MKSSNEINSHIFVPKSILNRFSNKDEKGNNIVKYIDLNDMQVKSAKTSSFNTQLGYYNINNEKILDKEAESKIGNVIMKLLKLNLGEELKESEINMIYKFLTYQIIRTEYFSEKLKERLGINIRNKVIKNVMIAKENEINTLYKVVKNLDMHIIINKTDNKFIIPISTMYTFNSESESDFIWIQILSPDIAIVFMDKGKIKKISSGKYDGNVQILLFEEEQKKIIDGFNIRAIVAQYKEKTKMRYVIGRKKELEKYLKVVKK